MLKQDDAMSKPKSKVHEIRAESDPTYKAHLKAIGDTVDWTDFEAYVTDKATRRKDAGNLHDDVDFALGAMTAYFYFQHQDKIPSNWVWKPLGNESPFGFDQEAKR